VLAGPGTEIFAPELVALVTEGSHVDVLAVPDRDVDAVGIGSGGGRGERSRRLTQLDEFAREIALPENLAVDGVEAQERALLAVLAGGQQINVPVPDDGAGIADAWNGSFPENARGGAEFDRDILAVGAARAVGPAEARPCLCVGGWEGPEQSQGA
jgi:hypothetical protein